jgi:phosphate transport system ATP-binding protein
LKQGLNQEETEMTLQLSNISILKDQATLFEPVSFEIGMGLQAIVGLSGCGKSSLLMAAVGLLAPNGPLTSQGTITLNGKGQDQWNPLVFRRHVTLVNQHPVMFYGSISDNICIGALDHKLIPVRDKRDFALAQLKKVGLYSCLKNRLNECASGLSLGQKQRVSFARALAIEPSHLLLDEPTSSLDAHSAGAIEELMMELKKNMGIILVSHNKIQVDRLSDNCIEIVPVQHTDAKSHNQNASRKFRGVNSFFSSCFKPFAKEV